MLQREKPAFAQLEKKDGEMKEKKKDDETREIKENDNLT